MREKTNILFAGSYYKGSDLFAGVETWCNGTEQPSTRTIELYLNAVHYSVGLNDKYFQVALGEALTRKGSNAPLNSPLLMCQWATRLHLGRGAPL